MSEYWNAYFSFINDKPATVVLDMEVTEEVNIEDYPTIVCIKLQLKNPDERGFPSKHELEVLEKVNKDIEKRINLKLYLNVGRVTTDGFRELVYYTSEQDPKMLIEVAEQIIEANDYEFEMYGMDEEELWEYYFEFLYPNQYHLQHISNAELIEQLQRSGDKLKLPRKVEHFILFNDEIKIKEFISEIAKEGFNFEGKYSNNDEDLDEEYEFTVRISRLDHVDLDSIDELTDYLIEASEHFGGNYDGWETLVIKDKH
ncbi:MULTISPECIES: DUF695 domain-containing protein [Bacillaceae]|uniref:DUF695 domain-containing protein n=1 Tax=Bacillaceae TaxID=186817 RepID=UPI000BF7B958|nr:DUF695 domain-containing protein [Bacillus sp. AFS077874]PFM83060.1 hypothetical protein COJ46_04495 [Bacillus sp. AFS077874]